jgi:hypothetical protein
MTKRTKVVLVAGTAALALAGIGSGVAFAASSGTSTPGTAATTTVPTTTAATPPAHPRSPGLLRGLEHGAITVRTRQGDRALDLQRGQVTAVSATSVTVRSGDGFTATYTVASTSKVRVQKQASSISAVHDGDRVSVVALHANGTDTVRSLFDAK